MENLSSFLMLYPEFKLDINVTEGKISASRFFVQTLDISNASMEIMMFHELRDTAQNCSATKLLYSVPPSVHLLGSIFCDSDRHHSECWFHHSCHVDCFHVINPKPALFPVGHVLHWLGHSVTGFMALWGVNLDSISMIILVVCIGFTVDFFSHISYAFVSSKKSTANERVIDALFSLGYLVLQGAASTIIGVLVLAASKNHIFRTFFKIMFLIMLFGLAHSIIFIPVFLTLLSCSSTATVPDIPKIIMLENKSLTYDNYTFTKDNYHVCKQTMKTQSTQIYFIPHKMLSVWCHDPDCP